jgi:hypothetical protein
LNRNGRRQVLANHPRVPQPCDAVGLRASLSRFANWIADPQSSSSRLALQAQRRQHLHSRSPDWSRCRNFQDAVGFTELPLRGARNFGGSKRSTLKKLCRSATRGPSILLFKRSPPRGWRLAQPASLNGSLFGSKRDRKIAASIGSFGLGDRRAYIALPVSPTMLFVAAHDPALAAGSRP